MSRSRDGRGRRRPCGAFLVIAHDPDPHVRARLSAAARRAGALVNVVDDIPACDWAMPAIVRRGELLLAIGTGGASPALARKMRERLETEYGPEWAEVLRVLREVPRRNDAAAPRHPRTLATLA